MNFKIYEKSLAVIIGGLMLTNLSGCGKKSEKDSMKNESSRLVVDDVESAATEVIPVVTTELVTTTSNSVTTLSTIPVVTTVTTSLEEEINNCDTEVLNHFKAMNDNMVDSYNLDSFLETGKKYFIYCVDFLFYDAEIKGIRFSDLTDMTKQQLLRDISTIDELICSKYPNYKEDIDGLTSDAYNKAALLIKAGSENIKEFSKEKLGEENYNKIKYYKDMVVSQTVSDFNDFKDILGDGKQFIKDWYEGLK